MFGSGADKKGFKVVLAHAYGRFELPHSVSPPSLDFQPISFCICLGAVPIGAADAWGFSDLWAAVSRSQDKSSDDVKKAMADSITSFEPSNGAIATLQVAALLLLIKHNEQLFQQLAAGRHCCGGSLQR